jgi:hypothetical protein
MSVKRALVAACIVAAGLVIRLPGLGDPPLDFHPTRQYRAAIIARGYSLDLLGGLEPGARETAVSAARGMPPIEPPVMEHLASWVYHVIGREDLAWARALAVIAWSLGGLAMFWLAIQLATASMRRRIRSRSAATRFCFRVGARRYVDEAGLDRVCRRVGPGRAPR